MIFNPQTFSRLRSLRQRLIGRVFAVGFDQNREKRMDRLPHRGIENGELARSLDALAVDQIGQGERAIRCDDLIERTDELGALLGIHFFQKFAQSAVGALGRTRDVLEMHE